MKLNSMFMAVTFKPGEYIPESITVDGVVYTRLRFDDEYIDTQVSSQILYGRTE